MRSVDGVFFEGLQKSSILDLANGKGGKIVSKLGYPALTANAMALRVSRQQFVAALRHARGDLSPEWQKMLNANERLELEATDSPSDVDYVHFASPLSAKKRRLENTPEANSETKSKRACDATPMNLFTERRARKPKSRLDDEPDVLPRNSTKLNSKGKKKRLEGKEDGSDETDDNSEGELDYTDINADDLVGTESEVYGTKLNKVFEDTEDGVRFIITNICVSTDPSLGFFFKYREEIDKTSDFEYTPCSEILEASWVKWCDRSTGKSEIS